MHDLAEVLLWSHHCKVNTLFANSYLSSYEQRKRFVSIKITGTRICGKNSVQEIFLDAFSVVCRLHYLATTIDFLATLAFFCFSCEGHRTIGIEAPDRQKSKIKLVSPILSETMDGKR